MNQCDILLKDIKASKQEIAYIKKHLKAGGDTEGLIEKLANDIENQRFRSKSNKLSEAHTKSFQEKIANIVQNDPKPYKTLFKYLVGETSGITSKALARAHARFGYFSSRLRMGNSDIKKLLNDQNFVKDFVKELDQFGTPKTKNKLAYEMAEAVTEYQKRQRLEVNSFGGGVFWRDDYITKQWHDSYRMLKSGKDKWVQDIYLALDHDATKDRIRHAMLDRGIEIDPDKFDLKKYLKSSFEQMTVKPSKSGLLLDNLHLKRIFKFKDNEYFINYNKHYGQENIAHAVFENMTMMDNHIAYGEAFGYGYRTKIEPDEVTLRKAEDELAYAKETGNVTEINLAQEAYDNLFWNDVSPVDEMQKALYILKDSEKISKRQNRR